METSHQSKYTKTKITGGGISLTYRSTRSGATVVSLVLSIFVAGLLSSIPRALQLSDLIIGIVALLSFLVSYFALVNFYVHPTEVLKIAPIAGIEFYNGAIAAKDVRSVRVGESLDKSMVFVEDSGKEISVTRMIDIPIANEIARSVRQVLKI